MSRARDLADLLGKGGTLGGNIIVPDNATIGTTSSPSAITLDGAGNVACGNNLSYSNGLTGPEGRAHHHGPYFVAEVRTDSGGWWKLGTHYPNWRPAAAIRLVGAKYDSAVDVVEDIIYLSGGTGTSGSWVRINSHAEANAPIANVRLVGDVVYAQWVAYGRANVIVDNSFRFTPDVVLETPPAGTDLTLRTVGF